jgi:hypothetical protein
MWGSTHCLVETLGMIRYNLNDSGQYTFHRSDLLGRLLLVRSKAGAPQYIIIILILYDQTQLGHLHKKVSQVVHVITC